MHQFIQDAIKGGWNKNNNGYLTCDALLDPKAWQAVGNTRGWNRVHELWCYSNYEGGLCDCVSKSKYKHMQIEFIRNLQDGLSIEEALNKIK